MKNDDYDGENLDDNDDFARTRITIMKMQIWDFGR